MTQPDVAFSYIAPVLRVSDLMRSVAFYRDRLGFEVAFIYEGFYAEVRRDGCHVHLQCSAPTGRDQAAFERAEHIDLCIVICDAAQLCADYTSAGAPIGTALREMPYGTEFYVRDPDGYILGFVQPTSPANGV